MNQYLPEERLYKLLPAIYQIRDQIQGEPLRALLAIASGELQVLEEDIARLYENWFIETCDEWVVPYIGDLLDVQELYTQNVQNAQKNINYGQQQRRAYIANTIAYRRRKGTAPILEQLTRDITDWRARAVEFFQGIATTQNLNHLRPRNTTVNLRQSGKPEFLGTPFEQQVAYSINISNVIGDRGFHNIPNIGLYIWRLQSYPLEKATARMVKGPESEADGRYYTFNQVGDEQFPLFNQPQTETDIVHLAEEINVPAKLRRPPLNKELEERRQQLLQGIKPGGIAYFDADPVLEIFINGQPEPISPEEIWITALKKDNSNNWITVNWEQQSKSFPTKVVAVDPGSGRLAFPESQVPSRVEVSYFYGFSGDVGGGSYDRNLEKKAYIPTKEITQRKSADVNPLATVIQDWNCSVEAWQYLLQGMVVDLGEILVTGVEIIAIASDSLVPRFKPGVIRGLEVTALVGNTEASISSGAAIDRKGRLITLDCKEKIDLQQYGGEYIDKVALLVIAYSVSCNWQIFLVPETAEDGYPQGSYITLAQLEFDKEGKISKVTADNKQFQPGIVSGLEVVPIPGKMEAIVTPGTAVNHNGCATYLVDNQGIDFRDYQGETLLVLFAKGQVCAIQEAESGDYPEESYIRLGSVEIPRVGVEINQTESPQQSLLEVIPFQHSTITIKAGTVSDQKGNQICLENDCQLDVSAFPGETLILFIANQSHLGLPNLRVVNHGEGEGWQKLGVVSQDTFKLENKVITIADNKTYKGDLTITVPADKRLKITAADSYRPHLQGNLYVQGVTPPNSNPGELILEGLLVEGKLTILPGNFRSLQINHCTLVPKQGGLIVTAVEVPEEEDGETSDESLTLIAIAIYFLNVIRNLLRGKNSQQSLDLLLRIAIKQARLVFSQLRELIQWQCLEKCPIPDDCLQANGDNLNFKLDNSRLSISIYRSICGALHLAETVPKLVIADSIIDNGLGAEVPQGIDVEKLVAIVALGTAVEGLHTSTVFGSTKVRSLEASDSIFTSRVTTLRKQIGCMRFCYVPDGSQTPRRYLCQPDRALVKEFDLDKLPPAITCLAINPQKINPQNDRLFAGTAGKGVLSYQKDKNQKDNNKEDAKWKPVNEGLTNPNITALLFTESYGFAGATGGSIFRTDNNGETWTQINIPENREIKGGTGTISSAGRRVKGNATKFNDKKELNVGDIITAKGQTRTVTQIDSDEFLWVNAPFEPNLDNNNFNITTAKPNTDITAFAVDSTSIFVTTAGSGIFSTLLNQQEWTAVNNGLTNLYVMALVVDPKGDIFAGTYGGVFYSQNNGERWIDINTGLTNLEITALAVDLTGQVFTGTPGGVFRLDSDSKIWTAVNQGLTNPYITALGSYGKPGTGTISSNGTTVNGEGTNFAKGLVNHTITAGGQTRTVKEWKSPAQIILDQAFCPDLPPKTTFTCQNLLVAGTVGGDIFYSQNHGENWQSADAGLSDTDITDVSIDVINDTFYIYASTTVGTILCSPDLATSWRSHNSGLVNVQEKLLILSRIKPRFNSTQYGDPGYAQLSDNCAAEIRTGAEDTSEMGVFSYLKQPQRQSNLEASLKEYLRFGLEVSIFYKT